VTNVSDTIDAILRDITRGMTRQTVIDYHTSNRPDADKVKTIVADVERGVPKAVAIAYHTANVAPRPTQVRTIRQTVTVTPRPRPSNDATTIEQMSPEQVTYALRRLAARYNYVSIAESIRYRPSETGSGHAEGTTVPTVRSWCLGNFKPGTASVAAIRRFLIKHRDHRDSLDLRPAGLRFAPRG